MVGALKWLLALAGVVLFGLWIVAERQLWSQSLSIALLLCGAFALWAAARIHARFPEKPQWPRRRAS